MPGDGANGFTFFGHMADFTAYSLRTKPFSNLTDKQVTFANAFNSFAVSYNGLAGTTP